uniref:Inhibitor I9 domain-containing protein n=1 Tax=Leersia perrieri TaxID=77586 RepID=A0A0D9X685_9ORYZ
MTTPLPLIPRYHVACLILLVLQRPQPRAQQDEVPVPSTVHERLCHSHATAHLPKMQSGYNILQAIVITFRPKDQSRVEEQLSKKLRETVIKRNANFNEFGNLKVVKDGFTIIQAVEVADPMKSADALIPLALSD